MDLPLDNLQRLIYHKPQSNHFNADIWFQVFLSNTDNFPQKIILPSSYLIGETCVGSHLRMVLQNGYFTFPSSRRLFLNFAPLLHTACSLNNIWDFFF